MIKFFRQIRFKLMNENKTSRYFKYAIGEIILVVVGILIALQINNWNEKKKLAEESQYYLNRLYEDLVRDTTGLNTKMLFWKNVSDSGKKALGYLNQENPNKQDKWSALLAFYNASQINNSDIQKSTYEELKFSGKLGSLINQELRKKLATYYEFSEGNAQTIWTNIPKYREKMRGVIPVNVQEYIFDECHKINDLSRDWFKSCEPIIDEAQMDELLSSILANNELLEQLRYWIIDRQVSVELAENHIPRAITVMQAIEDVMN